MKKVIIFVAVLLGVVLLYACSAQPENVGLPNPVVEADDASAFDELGLPINAPAGAENIQHSIIDNKIAQIQFASDGISYTYRAAHTADDISGVYETFEEAQMVLVDAKDWTAAIEIKMIKDGTGGLASWRFDQTAFTLFTPDSVSSETLTHTAMELAEKAFAAFGVS